ncbi:MAG: hypothetical protein RIB65_19280 [Ilumatobacter fluminis]|uniref:type IV pilus modification PilV family protein n=1 Tax=Ilumatobacter fluminis TaxID=467091 RepID=UPI0032EB6BAD
MPGATTPGADATGTVDSRSDHGVGFVEVLVSIVLLGTVVIAVLVGLTTTIIGADEHRDQSTGIALVVDGLESVKNAAYTCSGYDATVGVTVPAGWTVTVTQVESGSDGTTWGACDPSDPLQRVTVVASDGASDLDGQVVKRQASP